jgi:putative oxidoreductase
MTTIQSETNSAERWSAIGWLVLRLGIGCTFLFSHGLPKLLQGPELWGQLGQAMGFLGITFLPVVWGFLAALAEALGGLLLIVGLCVRPAAAFMLITMLVATRFHMAQGEPFLHPLELAVVFLALLVSGGGPLGISGLLPKKKAAKEAAEDEGEASASE